MVQFKRADRRGGELNVPKPFPLAMIVVLVLAMSLCFFGTSEMTSGTLLVEQDASPASTAFFPSKCTADQLDTVMHQLPPDHCEETVKRPWVSKCSFSYATRCPEAIWVAEHFRKHLPKAPVGMYIGCNKGMDAVNTLRMLSSDPAVDKERWRETILADTEYAPGHCKQELEEQWRIPEGSSPNSAVVHCIEAMPITFARLNATAHQLHLESKLNVVHAAMAREDGTTWFPAVKDKIGVEGLGLKDCSRDRSNCEEVPLLSLDSLMERYVPKEADIDLLSVDVEGFDWEVLAGGAKSLRRIRYLEFEYNWKGMWPHTKLSEAIDILRKQNFVCYWAGMAGHIWRITDCFLPHYDLNHWSNVACVNLNIPDVAPMARRMEELFLKTLSEGKNFQYESHEFKRSIDTSHV